MREYGFSLIRILAYKDRIYDSILIRENTGQQNPVFSHILGSVHLKTIGSIMKFMFSIAIGASL